MALFNTNYIYRNNLNILINSLHTPFSQTLFPIKSKTTPTTSLHFYFYNFITHHTLTKNTNTNNTHITTNLNHIYTTTN